MLDVAERVCTGYTSLLRAQTLYYRSWANARLGDAPSRGEYLGDYRARVVADSLSLYYGDADTDDERGTHTPLLHGDGDVL